MRSEQRLFALLRTSPFGSGRSSFSVFWPSSVRHAAHQKNPTWTTDTPTYSILRCCRRWTAPRGITPICVCLTSLLVQKQPHHITSHQLSAIHRQQECIRWNENVVIIRASARSWQVCSCRGFSFHGRSMFCARSVYIRSYFAYFASGHPVLHTCRNRTVPEPWPLSRAERSRREHTPGSSQHVSWE